MSMKKTVTNTMVAGAVAMALFGFAAGEANAETTAKEKCYGVAKAGMNDCGDAEGRHGCMGHAETDGDGSEWVAMPKGLCEKIVGGSLEPVKGDAEKASCESKNGCEGKEDKEG